MVCASVHKLGDLCWHAPFGLRVHGSELASLEHDLYVRMRPVQAPQHPADRLALGGFGKNTHDRNDTLRCAPLPMELIIDAALLRLPYGCMSTD